jgi:hypothetical protein
MKLKDIQDRVDAIKAISVDDEAAHSAEDALREDFIRYVAETATPSLAAKARLVLSTKDITFNRWCA